MVFRSVIGGVIVLCTTVLVLIALPLSNNTATADPTACVCGIFGDLNCDGRLDPVDIVYIVQFVYKNQDARCAPDILDCPILLGDVNCDGAINPVDVIYYARVIYGNQDAFCANPCPPTGVFTDRVGCLDVAQGSTAPPSLGADECVEYTYDGVGTLTIRHLNACHNCAPILNMQVRVTSGLITIEEGGSGTAYCECLYEFDYQIDNLPPGVYTIYVIGHCDLNLSFTADLISSPTGNYCVYRNVYPW